jgi:glutamate decarboxylase
MVLAQYYNFIRYGRSGYAYIMETMQANARSLAEKIQATGHFQLVGAPNAEQLPLVAFQLAGEHGFDEFDVAIQLAAERGWMVPAYTLPPDAQDVTIMRALVKQTLGHSMVSALAGDLDDAYATLEAKGVGMHELDRDRLKQTGFRT